jgi:hypothetical protein
MRIIHLYSQRNKDYQKTRDRELILIIFQMALFSEKNIEYKNTCFYSIYNSCLKHFLSKEEFSEMLS